MVLDLTKNMAAFKGIFIIKVCVSDLNLESMNAVYAYLYVNPKKAMRYISRLSV